MRKQGLAILCCYLALFNGALFGAFNANTQWEVRTTGNAANGGGFAYGLGAKDVTAATDLVVDASNNKVVTSATHNFVAGDVGKFINVTAGTSWTFGWYQIISTASNAATLNLSPAPVSTTGGTYDLYAAIDYSQQDAVQIAFIDIVVGATTTQGTSVLNPFTDAMVGNIINVTAGAGCTVQRAQIISQTAGTATFDKSLGTAASVCTGGLGGGFLTIAAATALVVSGNTAWIKSGTYTVTAIIDWNTDKGTQFYSGYQTVHGDHTGTRPLITTATNAVPLWKNSGSTASTVTFDNLSMSNTAAGRDRGIYSAVQSYVILTNSILDGFTNGISGTNADINFFALVYVQNTEIKNCTGFGIVNQGVVYVADSWIHNSTSDGINVPNNQQVILNRVILSANGGKGLNVTGTNTNTRISAFSSVFANNTGDGITSAATSGIALQMENSVIYGNGGYGVNLGNAADLVMTSNNAYGNNTTADVRNFSKGINDIALTASPFVSSTNFALNSTAGGGAALKQTGFPGVFPGGSSTGYLDVGAVQTSGAPGSGGAFNGAFAQ